MVIVKLYGGLGNQMFQYAAGRALSLKLMTNLYLDPSWFQQEHPDNITPREFELNLFGILPKKMNKVDQLKIRLRPPIVFQETDLNYRSQFKDLSGNILLDGYWQSYKYFEDFNSQIVNDFVFQDKLSAAKRKVASRLMNDDSSVSVHIRRGDYVNNPETNKFHGLIPISYYRNAITLVAKKIKSPNIYVISDDTQWCIDNLQFDFPTTFVKHTPGKGHEDMQLMSLCRHNIIANSSFSWWAAWLNSNPQKIVVSPKNWYQASEVNISDRVPSKWLTV